MHFVLTYDIHSTGQTRSNIENQISAVINQYSWVKPLTTTFVVNVQGQAQWDIILNALTNISRNNPSSLNFLMTPLMSGGRYNGMLNENLWVEINNRSN
jgi:hypothetical protein